MVVYSIKEIEKLSGVKAHTLRIWEKRYGVIVPSRTDTNIRFYTEEHLKKILNISFLNRHNHKISKIASLTDEELHRKVRELSSVDITFEDQLDALVLSLLELDSYNFNKIINQHIEQTGFESTMLELVYPLMDKLSVMWLAGSLKSAHEAFVTTAVKSKIIAATEKIEFIKHGSKASVLVFLPENEDHELSLLFLNFLLKKYHYKVVNLGINVALQPMKEAYDIFNPDFIFTIINDSFPSGGVKDYIHQLTENCPNAKMLLSGRQITLQSVKSGPNRKVFKSLTETMDFLENYCSKEDCSK